MSVDLSELLALPVDERLALAEKLMESAAPEDIGPLLREFATRTDRTIRALDALHERLSRLDERIERNRAEVREAVRRSGKVWPFTLPPR